MGQVVQLNNSRKDFIFYVRQLQKLCEKDLSLINSIIIDKLDSNVPLIQEIASHLILSGGKRLRPLLTVCCFQMCKDNNNESKCDKVINSKLGHNWKTTNYSQEPAKSTKFDALAAKCK